MLHQPVGIKQFAMKPFNQSVINESSTIADDELSSHASVANKHADRRAAAQNRVSAIGLAMLILSIFLATAGSHLAHVSPEIVKIVAVVIFVGSMLALAMGMIGETYRD